MNFYTRLNVFLSLLVLLAFKISSLPQQKESLLSTVMCTQTSKFRDTGSFKLLYSEIYWNCTRDSTDIYLSCKGSEQRDGTLNLTSMCCQVSVEKENSRLTRLAFCQGSFGARNASSMHNGTVQGWHCEWEWSALNISQQMSWNGYLRKSGIYYHYKERNNKAHLRTCQKKIKQTTTATSLPPVKQITTATFLSSINRSNGSSSINDRVKSLGNTLIKYVNQSRNCSASMIAELLMNIEAVVRPFLRAFFDSAVVEVLSFFSQIIDLHGVITTNLNKTLKVPDNLEAGQSQGLFILPPGSIDIKNGRLGIITVVFKFAALCKDTQDLELGSSASKRSLKSPIVSVLAMTNKGNVQTLQNNATLRFRVKRQNRSSVWCMFLNGSPSSNNPFWSANGMTFVDKYEENYISCLTNHLTSFAVLLNYNDGQSELKLLEKEVLALDLITKIGCSFAIFCLLGCILTFACVRTLSALRYRIHLHLCVALAAAQLIFITGIEATKIKGVCVAVAVMLHYFFTASFTWMCVEAIHMFSKIVSVFNIQTIRMRHYVAFGWGIPAVIVAISVTVHHEGYGTSKLCWLSLEGDLIWAFLTPVIVIVSINAIVLVAIMAVRVSIKGNPLSPRENKKFVAALKTVIVLFPLLGLCWFFGLMGVLTSNRPFLYAFVVLSSFQGCFILLFHCIGNSEVRGSIKSIKERHSLESSIRHEQKNRLQETRKMQKNGARSTEASLAERKILLTKVSGLNGSKQQREEATHV